jgi:hypothetical protein
MLDRNDLDQALFGIRQMALVAIGAQESLMGSETRPGVFEMPAMEANLLSFSVFDLLDRVEALEAAICASSACPDRQAA